MQKHSDDQFPHDNVYPKPQKDNHRKLDPRSKQKSAGKSISFSIGNLLFLVVWFLVLPIFFLTTMSIYFSFLQYRLPPGDLLPYQVVLVIIGVIFIGLVCIVLSIRMSPNSEDFLYSAGLRYLHIALNATIMVLSFWFVFTGSAMQPKVEITHNGFTQTVLHVNSGETVRFSNKADGIKQVLCVGAHNECLIPTTVPDAPAKLLSPGLRIQPGQNIDVVFDSVGTFQIISTTMPNSTVTIDVTEVVNNPAAAPPP